MNSLNSSCNYFLNNIDFTKLVNFTKFYQITIYQIVCAIW